ncbi:PH domain-like protein [Polyplosphaeria fusca]|uniref:PH domain-like protein n=1 Tax=Polyplosphaeria fusca TaxID=682080 RepID=A0A9P4QPW7_9PLEO|nr:PH domain-like protein [Polyplosphaeria fusca]
MAPNKSKSRTHQHQPPPQPSDYETDAPPPADPPPPPPRSNEELNLSVLCRRYPDITSIEHVAPYSVLYTFSLESQQWEKVGIEGTLFVCQLSPSPIGADRFSVVMLNRRGLENFAQELTSDAAIEISGEYVIVQGEKVYGIWIFSDPPPASTSNMRIETQEILQRLAKQAEESKKACEASMGNGAAELVQVPDSTPMGRQLSLSQLFQQQRVQDAGFSVRDHHSPTAPSAPMYHPGVNSNPHGGNEFLSQLFAKARQEGFNGVG